MNIKSGTNVSLRKKKKQLAVEENHSSVLKLEFIHTLNTNKNSRPFSCILTATFSCISVWIILYVLYTVARMYVDTCLFLTACNLVRKLRTERCRIVLYFKKHEKWFTRWMKSEIEMWQSEDRIRIKTNWMWRLLSGHGDAYSLIVIRDERINICKRRALRRNFDTWGIYLPRFIWSSRCR